MLYFLLRGRNNCELCSTHRKSSSTLGTTAKIPGFRTEYFMSRKTILSYTNAIIAVIEINIDWQLLFQCQTDIDCRHLRRGLLGTWRARPLWRGPWPPLQCGQIETHRHNWGPPFLSISTSVLNQQEIRPGHHAQGCDIFRDGLLTRTATASLGRTSSNLCRWKSDFCLFTRLGHFHTG